MRPLEELTRRLGGIPPLCRPRKPGAMRSRRYQPTQPLQEPDGVGGRPDQLQRTTKAEAAAETRTPAAASPTSARPAARTSSCGSLRSVRQQRPISRPQQPARTPAAASPTSARPAARASSCGSLRSSSQPLRLPPEQQPAAAISSQQRPSRRHQQPAATQPSCGSRQRPPLLALSRSAW